MFPQCLWRHALGWNPKRLGQRIHDIRRYYRFNSDVIPLSERIEIARKAQELLEIFERVGDIDLGPLFSETLGLDWLFLQTLKGLAAHSNDRQSVEGHVAAMIVRLYAEAHQKPGFAARGPLVRFAKAIYDLLEMPKNEWPSEATLKDEFNKLKLDAFISCRLEFVEGGRIAAADLLEAWKNHCTKNGGLTGKDCRNPNNDSCGKENIL